MRKDREKGKEEREKGTERNPGDALPSFPCQWALTAL
jgi:hypothetical protein